MAWRLETPTAPSAAGPRRWRPAGTPWRTSAACRSPECRGSCAAAGRVPVVSRRSSSGRWRPAAYASPPAAVGEQRALVVEQFGVGRGWRGGFRLVGKLVRLRHRTQPQAGFQQIAMIARGGRHARYGLACFLHFSFAQKQRWRDVFRPFRACVEANEIRRPPGVAHLHESPRARAEREIGRDNVSEICSWEVVRTADCCHLFAVIAAIRYMVVEYGDLFAGGIHQEAGPFR